MFAALEGQCWWTRDGTRHVVDTPHAVAAYTRAILAAVADDEDDEVWWSESRGGEEAARRRFADLVARAQMEEE